MNIGYQNRPLQTCRRSKSQFNKSNNVRNGRQFDSMSCAVNKNNLADLHASENKFRRFQCSFRFIALVLVFRRSLLGWGLSFCGVSGIAFN